MEHFAGKFFLVTRYSIFRISIPDDLRTSPEVMKVALRHTGKDLEVPVGGVLQGGFYLAITGLPDVGMRKYRMCRHQREPVAEAPKQIGEIKKSLRGTKTWGIVGLFMRRSDAEACFETTHQKIFDPRWAVNTTEVLKRIGMDHPLITISTEGEFAIPSQFSDLLRTPEETEKSSS
ncbi:MAG TPA: hypothetical protein VJH94_00135 [Candidatus Paceibacterota bacterium]